MNKNYYYSEHEWSRIGCGELPEERKYPTSASLEQNQYLVYPEENNSDQPINPYSQV
jgi:hypothetical protein